MFIYNLLNNIFRIMGENDNLYAKESFYVLKKQLWFYLIFFKSRNLKVFSATIV